MADRAVAVVVGAGPGLGGTLARRFARADMSVVVAARDSAKLGKLAADIPNALALPCDATIEADVERLFAAVESELGTPRLVVYNASGFARASILELDAADFERAWRGACLGGFLTGRAAARAMIARGQGGTILFTGATASLRGAAMFASFAAGKAGLRMVAQSMARELHPRGIHVAHVVIDGGISRPGSGEGLDPDAIAEAYYQLYLQQPAAWTQELELRSSVEKF